MSFHDVNTDRSSLLRFAAILMVCSVMYGRGPICWSQNASDDKELIEKKEEERRRLQLTPLPERMVDYLLKLDANNNGRLEPAEIPGRMKATIEQYAEELKLDASKPIPLDLLGIGIHQKFQDRVARNGGTNGRPLTSRDLAASRLRAVVERIIAAHDKNHDGKLDKAELRKAPETVAKLDKDKDGLLTVDELLGRLQPQRTHKAENQADAKDRDRGNRKSTSTRPGPSEKPSPDELADLPEELSEWFREKDRNGDGQVQMQEFTKEWSTSKVFEFRKFDLNKDGTITSSEYRTATQDQAAAAPKD